MADENNVDNITKVPRKRGRPRKNDINIVNIKKDVKKIPDKEKEIILHLPISFKDIDMDNLSDLDEDENNDENNNTGGVNSGEMLTFLDDENTSSTKNLYDLTKELNEKNKLIRKLKDELLENKSTIDELNVSDKMADSTVTNMNIPMIDNTNKEKIVPEKTDIVCWWCTHTFDTYPTYLPDHYHDGIFHVFGNFCSDNCKCAYNIRMNDYKTRERHYLINQMAKMIDKSTKEIVPAPSPEILKKFGGPVEIDEYRRNFIKPTKEFRFMIPPMISVMPTVETLIKEKSIFKDINKFAPHEDNEKPYKGSILSSMGIRVKKV